MSMKTNFLLFLTMNPFLSAKAFKSVRVLPWLWGLFYNNSYITPRSLFKQVFGTLHFDGTKRFIDEKRQTRYQVKERIKEKIIKVHLEVLKAFRGSKLFQQKKVVHFLIKLKDSSCYVYCKKTTLWSKLKWTLTVFNGFR